MRLLETTEINGYRINGELRSDNAGNSVWGSATKNGRKYFIKQLKETYYDIPYSQATVFQREDMEASKKFYERMKKLYALVKNSDNGNLIAPVEFIRKDGHYYLITEWIEQSGSFGEIKNLPPPHRHVLMKVLAYSLCGLAGNNIVHNDLKPDNLCIKETATGAKTLKIIDFDNGFIQGDYPEIIGGSQSYMSPEVFIRTAQDEQGAEERIDITPQSDIFSLGIIFHEILTGELPASSNPDIQYIGLAVGHGCPVKLWSGLNVNYSNLIKKMLSVEPAERPSAEETFNILKRLG